MIYGSKVGFSGSADLMVQLSNFKNPRSKSKMAADGHLVYHGGFHTRTAVARNPCISWAFLLCLFCDYRNCGSTSQANHNFPDCSLTNGKFPDFSRFFQVAGHPVPATN